MITGRTATVLLLLALSACQSSPERNDRVYRFVDEIGFGGPLDALGGEESKLVRWKEPIRLSISGTRAEELAPRVEERLDRLATAAGMDWYRVDDVAGANLTVEFLASRDFLTNREYVPCYVRLRWDDYRIKAAEVQISVAEPDKIDRCIAHELMHAFGFRYHSGILRSILSPAHDEQDLTEWDLVAIGILYDQRVTSGIERQEAAPLLRALVAERLE